MADLANRSGLSISFSAMMLLFGQYEIGAEGLFPLCVVALQRCAVRLARAAPNTYSFARDIEIDLSLLWLASSLHVGSLGARQVVGAPRLMLVLAWVALVMWPATRGHTIVGRARRTGAWGPATFRASCVSLLFSLLVGIAIMFRMGMHESTASGEHDRSVFAQRTMAATGFAKLAFWGAILLEKLVGGGVSNRKRVAVVGD